MNVTIFKYLKKPAGLSLVALTVIAAVTVFSCNTKLDIQPQGSLLQANIENLSGVNGLLIGAYAILDGENVPGPGNAYGSAGSNWQYGSVCADDSYKGSTPGDQPDLAQLEAWSLTQSSTNYLNEKWTILYLGIQRSNDVLRIMRQAKGISPTDTAEISGEARFLRGYYHMDGRRIFHFFPYVDESISFVNNNVNLPNNADIWPQITADLLYAVNNLPETQPQAGGRVNKWAAMAFLAKDYMIQRKFDSAKFYLDQLIANGHTASGQKYALVNFESNFNAPQKNGPESVFACQNSVNDGSASTNDGGNGNMGDVLNFPYGSGPVGCCGFNNPSWNLANAFKTDANGLPLLDGSFNSGKVVSDSGNLYTGTVDPRIDWTMSRPGIPYLDWGLGSATWIRDPSTNGIFDAKKNVYAKSQQGKYSSTETVFWGATQITANNTNLMRFSDVLLMAAECEVEANNLDQAQIYVNMVRARAADPAGWVYKNSTYDANNGVYATGGGATPADNYLIKQYPPTAFSSKGQDYARDAIHFERRLELAMEGHRFFDLQRWDNGTGSMAATLNAYEAVETTRSSFYFNNPAHFTKGVNEYFAIPQEQIDLENAGGANILKQNFGYN